MTVFVVIIVKCITIIVKTKTTIQKKKMLFEINVDWKTKKLKINNNKKSLFQIVGKETFIFFI